MFPKFLEFKEHLQKIFHKSSQIKKIIKLEGKKDRQTERKKKVRNESKGDRGLSLRIGQCHGLRERKKRRVKKEKKIKEEKKKEKRKKKKEENQIEKEFH